MALFENDKDAEMIGSYRFVQTCWACPEQYDIFGTTAIGEDKLLGYVRLRGGKFRVDCPNCGDETVLEHYFDDPLQGSFDNDTQRLEFLQKAAVAVTEWWLERDR